MALIKKSSKPGFAYKERTSEDMESRQKSFSGRDSYFSGNVKFFITKPGANKIRILPPTWDDARHYGYDIFVHYGIGPDNVGYLCLDRMSGEKCSLCEARSEADRSNEEDLAKALRATRRVAVYVIDRNAESEGPKIWAMPQTVDKEICAQAWDKETGEVYALDNPDEGYDVAFEVEGQGQTKKYVGVRLARRGSPLLDDDKTAATWLQYIVDHPIPDELVLHDYDAMKQAFEGKPAARTEDETDKASKKTGKALIKPKVKAEEEVPAETKARPKIGTKKAAKEPEPEETTWTWEDVHAMDEDAIGTCAEENNIDFGDTEFDSLEACQDFMCEKLEIEAPAAEEEEEPAAKPVAKKAGSSLADKLRSMGKKK